MSASSSRSKGIHMLRSLYRELRPSVNEPQKHVYETPVWNYIIKQCRNSQNKAYSSSSQEEMSRNLVRAGEYYIESIRAMTEYSRIQITYKGKGERTPKDLAAIFGFRMPDEPKDAKKSENTSETQVESNNSSRNS